MARSYNDAMSEPCNIAAALPRLARERRDAGRDALPRAATARYDVA